MYFFFSYSINHSTPPPPLPQLLFKRCVYLNCSDCRRTLLLFYSLSFEWWITVISLSHLQRLQLADSEVVSLSLSLSYMTLYVTSTVVVWGTSTAYGCIKDDRWGPREKKRTHGHRSPSRGPKKRWAAKFPCGFLLSFSMSCCIVLCDWVCVLSQQHSNGRKWSQQQQFFPIFYLSNKFLFLLLFFLFIFFVYDQTASFPISSHLSWWGNSDDLLLLLLLLLWTEKLRRWCDRATGLL